MADNDLLNRVFLSTPPSRVATGRVGHVVRAVLRFYPRHPRGWRPAECNCDGNFEKFLSTPPSRVATPGAKCARWQGQVSIHATLAGGDSTGVGMAVITSTVSIHATLAGGDLVQYGM